VRAAAPASSGFSVSRTRSDWDWPLRKVKSDGHEAYHASAKARSCDGVLEVKLEVMK